MSDSQDEARPPIVKRVGHRRVQTEPVAGQVAEPNDQKDASDVRENDDRLKADKPPHY
jgi:hypothetical protein